jgi:hypothetical protein
MLGVFLFNTLNELKFKINKINYNNLKKNFSSIIIIDIENSNSLLLKEFIENDINNYNNIKLETYIINNNLLNNDNDNDFDIKKIIYLYENNINNLNINNYITFINDNYIYCNNLNDYFKYIDTHSLEFYSLTDLYEEIYYYQLYFISVHSNSLKKLYEFIKNNDNDKKDLYDIFDKKICYLKLAYLDTNYELNIFNNNYLYEYLLKNDILPVISINKLNTLLTSYVYDNNLFRVVPENFELNIYKNYEDLKHMNDEQLYIHFINYGQKEHRRYSSKNNYINYVLPTFLREKLKLFDLLYYFDIPDSFDYHYYKDNNKDISNLNEKDIIIHWINNGRYENRLSY